MVADKECDKPRSIRAAEIARARSKPTERLDAYDLYLRAVPEIHTGTIDGFLRAETLLRDALVRDLAIPKLCRLSATVCPDWSFEVR